MTMLPLARCQLDITGETLAALRDDALDPDEAQTLRQHIPTCAACMARLANFDRVARALRVERDLEPDGRIWAALQPRISRKDQRNMSLLARPVLRGGLAMLSVVLIITLFALVLTNHRSGGPGTAVPTATRGQTNTPPVKPTPVPTGTSGVPTGLLTPQQAWGAGGTGQTINIGNLTVKGVSPDGQHLLGYELSADGKFYHIGWLSVATGAFTTFDQSAVSGPYKLNNPPICCVTDGRFVVGANGASEGSSTDAPWYYDVQTQQLHTINSVEFFAVGIHDGVAYHEGRIDGLNPQSLYGLNLLTGTDSEVPGTSGIFNVGSVVWPTFAYSTSVDGVHFTLHAHNLQTQADVAMRALGSSDGTVAAVALDNDNVFDIQPGSGNSSALREWDHVFTADSGPVTVATIPGTGVTLPGANARVVVLADSCQTQTNVPCNEGLAWDRTLKRLVMLSPSQNVSVWLAGNSLVVVDNQTHMATIYDSSTFATQ